MRFFIPHSYSGVDRTPFHSFCSQGQDEQNVANAFCTNHSHSRIVNKNWTRSKFVQLRTNLKSVLLKFHLDIISLHDVHRYNVRNAKDFRLPAVKTNWGKQRLSYHTIPQDWNSLRLDTRNCSAFARFKSKLFSNELAHWYQLDHIHVSFLVVYFSIRFVIETSGFFCF